MLQKHQRMMQSSRGKGKRGSIGSLKLTLTEIGSYDAFIAMMGNEDDLGDFNESDSPNPCILREIEEDKLQYVIRKSGKDKAVTLARVKRIYSHELN